MDFTDRAAMEKIAQRIDPNRVGTNDCPRCGVGHFADCPQHSEYGGEKTFRVLLLRAAKMLESVLESDACCEGQSICPECKGMPARGEFGWTEGGIVHADGCAAASLLADIRRALG
jgi:hypothetical protein